MTLFRLSRCNEDDFQESVKSNGSLDIIDT